MSTYFIEFAVFTGSSKLFSGSCWPAACKNSVRGLCTHKYEELVGTCKPRPKILVMNEMLRNEGGLEMIRRRAWVLKLPTRVGPECQKIYCIQNARKRHFYSVAYRANGYLKIILFIKLFFVVKSFIGWVMLKWKRKDGRGSG